MDYYVDNIFGLLWADKGLAGVVQIDGLLSTTLLFNPFKLIFLLL